WNARSYECKPRRHQRLDGKRYFQMASPFLAVATRGRMDSPQTSLTLCTHYLCHQ
ncbi:hypothetical protein KUCAC02_006382, partial [Chaenocephalus aceratus]